MLFDAAIKKLIEPSVSVNSEIVIEAHLMSNEFASYTSPSDPLAGVKKIDNIVNPPALKQFHDDCNDLQAQQSNQKIVDRLSERVLFAEQNSNVISPVEETALIPDSEVMTHFRASVQRNRHLGELLA